MARSEFATPKSDYRERLRVAVPPQVRRTAAPLVVGAADDRAEHEADRVADEVIGRLQSGEAGEAHVHDGCHGVARKEASASPGSAEVGFEGGAISDDLTGRIEAKRGSGQTLSDDVRRRMESGFGRSLADVRVHTDGESATLNRSISARAFTTGNDIFFGSGEFDPASAAGERVLAHEIAHTQQQGGGARRIHRWWDFSQPLDIDETVSMNTTAERFVWFMRDSQGDDMVVKLEGQPIGLGQLAGELHSSFGTAASVAQKKLPNSDKARIASLISDASVSTGGGWAKQGRKFGPTFKVPGHDYDPSVDDSGAAAQARLIAAHELATSTDELLAMTKAPGGSAEDMSKPNHGGQGYDPGVSRLRAQLDRPAHCEQLGRIAAVDLFLGNADRVTQGNMGNWFYDVGGAVTLIDHVDQGTGMAGKFMNPTAAWFKGGQAGDMLASGNLAATVTGAIREIAREANYHKDTGFAAWLKEDMGGKTRREVIEEAMVRGLKAERQRLIKVFTSTRFTIGGKKNRALKKGMKAIANQASADDSGHGKLSGGQADYYGVLKDRAAWLKKN